MMHNSYTPPHSAGDIMSYNLIITSNANSVTSYGYISFWIE